MKITDPEKGIEREVKELKIVFHKMPDKKGVKQDVKCVEFVIIGKNNEWDEWFLYDDFQEANPTIDIS